MVEQNRKNKNRQENVARTVSKIKQRFAITMWRNMKPQFPDIHANISVGIMEVIHTFMVGIVSHAAPYHLLEGM